MNIPAIICIALGFLLFGDSGFTQVPDSVAKAVITDPNGQPLPETMPLGEMVVFSFKRSVYGGKPESLKVKIEPPERAARAYFSDDMLTAYVPTGVKPVEIICTLVVAKGDIPDWVTIRVKCGEGAIPPPDPKPDPPKPTPVAKSLRLFVVEDQFNRRAETAITLNDRKFWDGLQKSGHAFMVIAANDQTELGKSMVAMVNRDMRQSAIQQGRAYLVVTDKDTGEILGPAIELPPASGIQAIISKYTGAK
jgi:hypothetical protein